MLRLTSALIEAILAGRIDGYLRQIETAIRLRRHAIGEDWPIVQVHR
jgi:hypothetical protein